MAERAAKDTSVEDIPSTSDSEGSDAEQGQELNILATPDETSDVILDVEGRELHANRGTLAHFSPVFRVMFFKDFKEKSKERVPLPDKKYEDMVLFFNVLLAVGSEAVRLVSDDNLLVLLGLADEYDAGHVKFICENYIGQHVSSFFKNFYCFFTDVKRKAEDHELPLPRGTMRGQETKRKPLIEKLTLYYYVCERYRLLEHQEDVKHLLLALVKTPDDLFRAVSYKSLPPESAKTLLEALCKKFHSLRNLDTDSDDESNTACHYPLRRPQNLSGLLEKFNVYGLGS